MPKILSKDPCDNKTERLSSPLLAQWVTQGPKGNQVQLKRKFSPKTLNQTASQGDMHMVFFFFFPPGATLSVAMIPFSRVQGGWVLLFFFFSLFSSFLMYEMTPFFTVDTYPWGYRLSIPIVHVLLLLGTVV